MSANLENSAVAAGLKKVSFHSNPKEGRSQRITIQLCSFHMLVRLCSKSFKLDFSSEWTKNFQMYKLGLKRQRNQRPNCQHVLDPRKSKGIPEKASISASLTMPKTLTVWITTICGKFWRRWDYQTTLPVSWETCVWDKKQQLERPMEKLSGSTLGKE